MADTEWAKADIAARLAQHLTGPAVALERMTRIQAAALAPLATGRDALVRARTGAGKTLAYSVPLVDWLVRASEAGERVERGAGVRGLVLVPTRELAAQVVGVLELIGRPFPWLVVGSVMGGEKRKAEKARLRACQLGLFCGCAATDTRCR